MTPIKIDNDDLRRIINEAVRRICEGQWYDVIPLCRFPYFVSITFSTHAIQREYEREITEDDVIEDVRKVIKDIIADFECGQLNKGNNAIKVINRETCVVTAAVFRATANEKRIRDIHVVTSYVWDGRVNIDNGFNYYVGEPSEEYLEAEEWNREHQDAVEDYADYKRGVSIGKQRKEAEREYKNHRYGRDTSWEEKRRTTDRAYAERARKEKEDIHNSLPDGDLDAIRDYYKYMDQERIDLDPLETWSVEDLVREAVKEAISEGLTGKMKKDTTRK